ncbi:recombinase family protein [Oscillospiraceae bacterium OttesenSCG-928-G22]|nr:recombinase family protein [Oscillospiraceae bacterium OttesenSCG-928-G22]
MDKRYDVGIYARLSVDDLKNSRRSGAPMDSSLSIQNQRELLSAHVRKMGWREVNTYIDDGVTGARFDRAGFAKMLEDAERGVINLILCKDLSRLGRDYIEVGRYTDFILPSLGCRLVCLQDGIDTGRDDNEMMPFRALMNDHYLADISKKIKAAHRVMASQGKRIAGRPPYGFTVDPADMHRYAIDDYAAGIVRRIYRLRLEGRGYANIAGALNADGVLPPREYEYRSKGKKNPYGENQVWLTRTIKRIVHSDVYIGTLAQCKSTTLSYKSAKVIHKPQEEWLVIPDNHLAIIDRETWDAVQEINRGKSTPVDEAARKRSLFRGLLRCPDCGTAFTSGSGHYQCTRHVQTNGISCANHHIREDELKRLLLDDIRMRAAQVNLDRDNMQTTLVKRMGLAMQGQDDGAALRSKLAEIDRMAAKLYEDKVVGIITADTFSRLMQEGEAKRKALSSKLASLEREGADRRQKLGDIDQWLDVISRHAEVQIIDRALLDELVEHIEVGSVTAEKNGAERREIKIFYKFVGADCS